MNSEFSNLTASASSEKRGIPSGSADLCFNTAGKPALFPVAGYSIALDFFTGPMDLLLHLIHEQEVSVEQVEMAVVCDQFLNIVLNAPVLDLDRATEYLVIAATLISLKSGTVVNRATPSEVGEGDLNQSAEFYEELRERLRQYELTKLRAEALRCMPQLGVSTFSRRVRVEEILQVQEEDLAENDEEELPPQDSNSLGVFFAKMLRRIGAGVNYLRIRLEPISVVKFMVRIVDTLHERLLTVTADAPARSSFFQMVHGFLVEEKGKVGRQPNLALKLGLQGEQPERFRGVVIGSFMGILELVRRGVLAVTQDEHGEDIAISLVDSSSATQVSAESISREENVVSIAPYLVAKEREVAETGVEINQLSNLADDQEESLARVEVNRG